MKITDFQNFIREFPYQQLGFDIKKKNWQIPSQQGLIDEIFKQSDNITLNRYDLTQVSENTEEFILKTLMWGYPTKGRGKNIDTILKKDNFNRLIPIIKNYRGKDITIERLTEDTKSINGLGLSTITKFTHFLDTTINGYKAVILDIQIIRAINTGRFEEFNSLKNINYTNAPKRYLEYIKTINQLAKTMNVTADQIELFLFTFGRTLSQLKNRPNNSNLNQEKTY